MVDNKNPGDVQIIGGWNCQVPAVLDMRITYIECHSYCSQSPLKVLPKQDEAKKKKYL